MIIDRVDNTYVKAGFFCVVRRGNNEVIKYPVANIFRIQEPYMPDDHLQHMGEVK
jgi:hypothetical protein